MMENHPEATSYRRSLEVRHLCPKCGGSGLCDVCLGVGTVDDQQLSRFLFLQSGLDR